jgi:NADH:ubiquinone oxidoreductase subunit F (NADH-binding)
VPDTDHRLLGDMQQPPRTSVDDYRRAGGYVALQRAVTGLTRGQVLTEVRTAGLRGRGGAGVLTAEKLSLVAQAPDEQKYVVCNAYDADPRSLISRTLLARDPHLVIEGLALAGFACGATEGYIFTRGAHEDSVSTIQTALRDALDQHILGRGIFGSRFDFTITVVGVDLGFMAGEETTMLEIIKGRRAMPQQRPPYPTQYGLYDRPTAIQNVETLANLPGIVARGGDAFRRIGAASDPGTKLFTVYGPGAGDGAGRLIEVPTGTPIAQALAQAGVQATPTSARGVVVGGLEGGVLPLDQVNTALDFEPLEEAGTIVGSSVIEVLPANTCMVAWAADRSRILAKESCGKCVPCRVGVKRITGTLEGIISDIGVGGDLDLLQEFSRYVPDGSLCGFGVHAVHPVVTAMRYFADDFKAHLEGSCPTGTCLPVRAHRYVTKHVL